MPRKQRNLTTASQAASTARLPRRVTSLDPGYQAGDLSVFPEAIDDYTTLYRASNFASASVVQAVPYTGKYIIVDDASKFPPQGLLCLGPNRGYGGSQTQLYEQLDSLLTGLFYNNGLPSDFEIVYYASRTNTIFRDLERSYCGSRQNAWPVGTLVMNAVTAEPHNACKDAIINIQRKIGTVTNTNPNSMYGRLLAMEDKLLAPTPYFRAYPRSGTAPLRVRFQNICGGQVVRYFWDFGDGTVSIEPNPHKVYHKEGNYTVKLSIVTETRGSGVLSKQDYISVSTDHATPFFYVQDHDGTTGPWLSQQTADSRGVEPTRLMFVDQTPGVFRERYWSYGDGSQPVASTDMYEHISEYIYPKPGSYAPTLLLVYAADGSTQQVYLSSPITIA